MERFRPFGSVAHQNGPVQRLGATVLSGTATKKSTESTFCSCRDEEGRSEGGKFGDLDPAEVPRCLDEPVQGLPRELKH